MDRLTHLISCEKRIVDDEHIAVSIQRILETYRLSNSGHFLFSYDGHSSQLIDLWTFKASLEYRLLQYLHVRDVLFSSDEKSVVITYTNINGVHVYWRSTESDVVYREYTYRIFPDKIHVSLTDEALYICVKDIEYKYTKDGNTDELNCNFNSSRDRRFNSFLTFTNSLGTKICIMDEQEKTIKRLLFPFGLESFSIHSWNGQFFIIVKNKILTEEDGLLVQQPVKLINTINHHWNNFIISRTWDSPQSRTQFVNLKTMVSHEWATERIYDDVLIIRRDQLVPIAWKLLQNTICSELPITLQHMSNNL